MEPQGIIIADMQWATGSGEIGEVAEEDVGVLLKATPSNCEIW